MTSPVEKSRKRIWLRPRDALGSERHLENGPQVPEQFWSDDWMVGRVRLLCLCYHDVDRKRRTGWCALRSRHGVHERGPTVRIHLKPLRLTGLLVLDGTAGVDGQQDFALRPGAEVEDVLEPGILPARQRLLVNTGGDDLENIRRKFLLVSISVFQHCLSSIRLEIIRNLVARDRLHPVSTHRPPYRQRALDHFGRLFNLTCAQRNVRRALNRGASRNGSLRLNSLRDYRRRLLPGRRFRGSTYSDRFALPTGDGDRISPRQVLVFAWILVEQPV